MNSLKRPCARKCLVSEHLCVPKMLQKFIYASYLPQNFERGVCPFAVQFYLNVCVIHQVVTPRRMEVHWGSALYILIRTKVYGIVNQTFVLFFIKIHWLQSCSSAVISMNDLVIIQLKYFIMFDFYKILSVLSNSVLGQQLASIFFVMLCFRVKHAPFSKIYW